jgi:hypothetical protein
MATTSLIMNDYLMTIVKTNGTIGVEDLEGNPFVADFVW